MSVTISALPTEILSQVIHHAVDDSRSTVVTCMLVNQLWHDTSLPILYKDLVLSCGRSLGRFIACHNQQALSLTKSFTFYLNHDNQSDRLQKGVWDRTELLIPKVANIMRSMVNLGSFSLIRHHRPVGNPSELWSDYEIYKPTRSNISAFLNNLPASCINLEIAVRDTRCGPEQTHLCQDLRLLLPRMVHVHINLDPVCDQMLGTWHDKAFHPVSLPHLRSLHLDCLKNKEWVDCPQTQPLKIWHSLVPALQEVATLSTTRSSARITALGVSPSGRYDKSIHRTFLLCNVRNETHNTKTWAFPVAELSGLRSLRAANYIRMKDGESYVAVDPRDVVTIAGGQTWRTLATGTRLPTTWIQGKVLMFDYGIFEYTEWTRAYPTKRPRLLKNERLARQRLVLAEEREGYQNTESLVEKTPKGFVRYGGPVWRNWELFEEDEEGPDGLTPDAPDAIVTVGWEV